MAIEPEVYPLAYEGEVPEGALELLDAEFGEGYAWKGFDQLYYAGEAVGHFALAEDGTCAGVCLGRYMTAQETEWWANAVGLPEFRDVLMSTVETLAVHPSHRGRRLGSSLVDGMIDTLLQDERLHAGYPSVLMANCWIRPSSCSEPLFLRAGFTVRGRVFDFWTERSRDGSFDCPVDRIPCHCTISNVIREIEQPEVRISSNIKLRRAGTNIFGEMEHAPLRTMMTRRLRKPTED